MESLTFFFSLSVCTLSHTLSACFSLSPSLYLYLYISASHSLSSSLSISLYLSSVLHCCLQQFNLFFIIYLSCFVGFTSFFLDNFIYFICQHAYEPATATAAAAAYPYPIASAPIYAANGTEATSTEYRKN